MKSMKKGRFQHGIWGTVVTVLAAILWVAILLCGCGRKAGPDNGIASGGHAEAEDEGASAEGAPIFEFLDGENWKDNTLDDYSAVLWGDMKARESDGPGELWKTWYVCGETRALLLQQYLLDEQLAKTRVELTCFTDGGETERIDLPEKYNDFCSVGRVLGCDHFVVMMVTGTDEKGRPLFACEEWDEELQVVGEFQFDFPNKEHFEYPTSVLMDADGNIHMLTNPMAKEQYEETTHFTTVGQNYFICDRQGNLLSEQAYSATADLRLTGLYNGQVALWGKDAETDLGGAKQVMGELYDYTLWDEETILYATNIGIFLSDRTWQNPRALYTWVNHGIRPLRVSLQMRQNGGIGATYDEPDSQKGYLVLEPVEERGEIQEITIAVNPYTKDHYERLVAVFNKKYPMCHVRLKSDYNQTALQTQLIAGDGPVLVDTMLTGFEGLEKYWQPLDGFLEAIHGEDDFYEKAMAAGEIDGRLYGIVDSFYLDTVVTLDTDLEPRDWDYEGFLDYVESKPSAKAIFQKQYSGNNSAVCLITSFLAHDLEDNYLMDAEQGETYFRTERFERILKIAEKLCTDREEIDGVESLKNGESLCSRFYVFQPVDVAAMRVVFGDDLRYIGYPTKDGAKNLLCAFSPLAIRVTATDSEKRIAYTFLKEMLSYESQSRTARSNFYMSVRKDVLNESIDYIMDHSIHSVGGVVVPVGDYQDVEGDRATLQRLIDEAEPRREFPSELSSILYEELADYFEKGEISKEAMVDHLENRVGLYLKERK